MQHAPGKASLGFVPVLYVEGADFFLGLSASVSLSISAAAAVVGRAVGVSVLVAVSLTAILSSSSRRRAVLHSEALLLALTKSVGIYVCLYVNK